MSAYAFLDPRCKYALPLSFDYAGYIDTERELWALFPETYGKRVNFCQLGLTASLYIEARDNGSELKPGDWAHVKVLRSDAHDLWASGPGARRVAA